MYVRFESHETRFESHETRFESHETFVCPYVHTSVFDLRSVSEKAFLIQEKLPFRPPGNEHGLGADECIAYK